MRLLLKRISYFNLAELIQLRFSFSSLKACIADSSNCNAIFVDILLETFLFSPPTYFVNDLAIFASYGQIFCKTQIGLDKFGAI